MSTCPQKSEDEITLKIVSKCDDDPMRAMEQRYAKALEALPKSLRSPIAEYVKHHIDLAQASAPVTTASLQAHKFFCLVSYALFFIDEEINRYITVNNNEVSNSLVIALFTFISVWSASAFFSLIMRVQTKEFKISSILIACTAGMLGFKILDKLEPWIFFWSPTYVFAIGTTAVLYTCISIFWVNWYLKKILPTTRAKVVNSVCVSITTVFVFSMIFSDFTEKDERSISKIPVVPFASRSGSSIDLDDLLKKNFSAAENLVKRKKN